MTDPVRVEGKLPLKVGDEVRVERAVLTTYGVKIKDAGWTRSKIIRFVETPSGLCVEVTGKVSSKGPRATTRTVSIDRVTRKRTQKDH